MVTVLSDKTTASNVMPNGVKFSASPTNVVMARLMTKETEVRVK